MLSRRRFLGTSLMATAASLQAGRAWSVMLNPASAIDHDLDAVTGDGKQVTLKWADVQELGDSLRGNLVLAGHPAYDPARRVWNAQMDKHPALIIQPRGATDVRSAVQFARASNLLRRREVRRAQPVGQVHLRARHAHRPVAAARRERGSGRAHRACRRWQPARRPGPRGHGPRTRDHGRHGVAHRSRWAHAGRRLRSRRAPLRPGARQCAQRRDRHGHGRDTARQRAGEPGAVLGRARWRRQLRRGHVV